MAKVVLTPEQLSSPAGKELLDLTVRSALDGRLELAEIKELRQWLRTNQTNLTIPAIAYLHDIMTRIAADGVIDKDELIELHLAIERVIPTSFRTGVKEARQAREAEAKKRIKERERAARAAEKARLRDAKEAARVEEERQRNRLRHQFAKVAGVTFPNADGTERQPFIRKCRRGDPLILEYERNNPYSVYATRILWRHPGLFKSTLVQIGYAPEYLAEEICGAVWTEMSAQAVIKNVTGGTSDKPIRGVNFVVIYSAPDVSDQERQDYLERVLSEDTYPPTT